MSVPSDTEVIYQTVFEDRKNIFLSGTGGCGKSYTLKKIYTTAVAKKMNVEITSTTGISAYQIQGRTIHSWAGFIFRNHIESESQFISEINRTVEKIKKNKLKVDRWKNTELLLIDEVSMMGGNYFDMLNRVGQKIRNNSLPFGGIQVVLSGDLLQLPPVKDIQVFESLTWEELKLETFMLTTPWRFNDKEYIELLKRIRLASFNQKDIETLQSRMINKLPNTDVKDFLDGAVHIFSLKREVDKYNKDKLHNVNSELVVVTSIDTTITKKSDSLLHLKETKDLNEENDQNQSNFETNEEEIKDKSCSICLGEFTKNDNIKYLPCFHMFHTKEIDLWLEKNNSCPLCRIPVTKIDINTEEVEEKSTDDDKIFENIFPCPKYLHLKIGCKVMLLINIDVKMGLVNGSIGTVLKITPENISVTFNNNLTIDIPPHDFEYEDYEVQLNRKQFPLTLAYAISIHKSQGSTIDRMVVDLGKDIFANGQAYVALSRCKNLRSLMLKNFVPYKIKSNYDAVQFERQLVKTATIL